MKIREQELEFDFPEGVLVRKFDNQQHKMTHSMKSVDFIVEEQDRYLFIECKDPSNSKALSKKTDGFIEKFRSGKLDEDLVRKYRDSFLYRWAEKATEKPIFYAVLIATKQLEPALFLARTEDLKRKLPVPQQAPASWRRQISIGCIVCDIDRWNQYFPNYPVQRVMAKK